MKFKIDQKIALASLLIAIVSCVGTYLAVPSIGSSILPKSFISSTPTISSSQYKNVPEGPYSTIQIDINKNVNGNNGYLTNAFYSIDYISWKQSKVLFHYTFHNSKNSFNILTCDLPKVVKTDYGDLGEVIEKGGAFLNVDNGCFIGLSDDYLVPMYEDQEGWLTYKVDLSRFEIKGIYTIDRIGDFTMLTFEIK